MSKNQELKNTTFDSSKYFLNRELSWIQFNERVLEEAKDKNNPLMERLRFLTIFENNLDEYFMVRVAGIKQKIANNIEALTPDKVSPKEQFDLIHERLTILNAEVYEVLNKDLLKDLEKAGINIASVNSLEEKNIQYLNKLFEEKIYPILTPLAVDTGRPFPWLANRSLNLAVILKDNNDNFSKKDLFAVVQIPQMLPRLFLLPDHEKESRRYVLKEDIIAYFAEKLFYGYTVKNSIPFKITRDSDLIIEEDEVDDLLAAIQKELRRREKGSPVRLEIPLNTPEFIVTKIKNSLKLEKKDIYYCDGIIFLEELRELFNDPLLNKESFNPFTPVSVYDYNKPEEIFELIKKNDIFIHLPYESFSIVEDFLNAAADDPNVLAIKQTLYRTGPKSDILDALIRAARNGKQVTALVEVKARFDEETNIQWAKLLEKEGIHVVYGIAGIKIHAKMALVLRKEGDTLQRYIHLSTGNYNSSTARVYTDMGYFTTDREIAEDINNLFNRITGYTKLTQMKKIFASPVGIKQKVIELIQEEIKNKKENKKAGITLKMNALVDEDIIRELYNASKSGIEIKLLIRGICCLVPGVKNISENIKVYSIVGRLLEHSRLFIFENAGDPLVFLSSADWRPRNFQRRIEIMFPILDENIKKRILSEIVPVYFSDNEKTRILNSEGKYIRKKIVEKEEILNAQEIFIKKSRAKLAKETQKTK
ncbi:MAG: polyphosphate kinase 1 [Spirochaetia bacterium]|nr:polyphosphate kinase 1 [Spirochaetia bacterium]